MNKHKAEISQIEHLPKAYARHRIITDVDGKPTDYIFIQVNAAFEEVTGLSRRDIIDKPVTEVLPGIRDDEADWIGVYGKIAQGGESRTFEQYSVPLGRWYGVTAYSDEPGYVSTLFEDVTERRKTYDALQNYNKRMELILEVSRAIAEVRKSSKLSQVIVDSLARLTEMKSVALYLLSDRKLRLEAAYPPLPPGFPEDLRTADLDDHPHIAEAVSSRQPVVLPDTQTADLSPAEQEVTELRNLRSILYIPLVYKKKCIGVLIPSSIGEVYEYTDEVISVCTMLAGQAALSLVEAQLAEKQFRYIQDIEQKNKEMEAAQKKIRRSEQRIADILQYADTISFISTDADIDHFRITEFSPGAEKMFGYKKEEVLGKDVGILHTEEDVKKFPDVFASMAERRQGFSGESVLIRKNGEQFPAMFRTYPIFDDEGKMKGTIGVSIDITERRKAEEEKARLQDQLAQSQKMEAVGQLAGGIAHDFNNMLSVILGYSDMIMEKLSEDDPAVQELREIHEAAQRSAGLTRQLLAFARQQAVEPKIIDINETIINLLGMLHRIIGEDIELAWMPSDDIGTLLMDPSQIDQILVNLCVNAREAISDTGSITIETSSVVLDDEYFTSHLDEAHGEYILVSVSDTGCGMDSDTVSHCMEPFFTTKGPGKGTGLGLPTVFGIVKQNNGLINIYSEPGQGTTVKIYLPAADTSEHKQQEHRARPAVQGGEKILLVDDDQMVRNLTGKMLEQLGYEVIAASSPRRAVELINDHRDAALMLTDVVMPDMNGKKLYETLQKELPHLQCLYMSGYTSNVIVHRGIVDEGIGFLQKPFSKVALSQKIREVLDS